MSLQCFEGSEIALGVEQRLNRHATTGTDKFVFQVINTDKETQSLHLDAIGRWAEPGRRHSPPEVLFFASVAHPNERFVRPVRSEPQEMTFNRLGTAHRNYHDTLGGQIPTEATSERLDGNLIAYPLYEDERARRVRQSKGGGGRLNWCARPARIAIQRFSSQLMSSFAIHEEQPTEYGTAGTTSSR